MSNKQYRLQRLQTGARFQEAQAKTKASEATLATAKAKLAEYKTKRIEASASKQLSKQIRKQEQRKAKQGNVVKQISGLYSPSKQFRTNLINQFSGFTGGTQSTSQSNRSVGRPKGVYRNTYNVPAQQYYKIQRQQKRLAQMRAEQIQQARLQALAQRGINPQQAQMIEQNRLQQMQQAQQMPNQPRQMPQVQQNIPQAGQVQGSTQQSIWRNNSYLAQEVGVDGRLKTVVRGSALSFWN